MPTLALPSDQSRSVKDTKNLYQHTPAFLYSRGKVGPYTMTLQERIKTFLRQNNRWVTRNEIYHRAQERKFKVDEIRAAIDALENDYEIGVRARKDGDKYINEMRWYEVSKNEHAMWKQQLQIFGFVDNSIVQS